MASKITTSAPATTDQERDSRFIERALLFVVLFLGSSVAMASSGDPLGSGMCKAVELFTGKWAFGLSVLALLGVAGAMLYGVEMTDIMKKLVTLFTAVALLVFGGSVLKFIFPAMVGC